MTSVTELYQQTLAERGYKADPAQLQAVAALQRCQDEWADYKARRSNAVTKLLRRPALPRGVYMFGGVGRGKSFLMDCFFQAVPLTRKTRLHFHEFMREVHRELQDLRGIVDPLEELGKRIAKRFRLICFEEFQRGVSVRKIPICRHIFHTVCIDGWFRAKINEATHHCPLCNASINYRILMEAIKKKKEENRANFTQKIGDGVQRVR